MIDPEIANERARRAYRRAGFRRDAIVEAPTGPVVRFHFGPGGRTSVRSFYHKAFDHSAKAWTVQGRFVVSREDADAKRAGYLLLYFWFAGAASGAGSALAQQQSFACTKLCWAPAKASVTCSKKLSTQIELTSYVYAVQHQAIAKGKAMTFFVDMRGSGQSCGSAEPPAGSLSVVGYVNVRNVTSFTIGGLKVGDTIEIGATGVAEGEKNILFFPDPAQR